MSNTAKGSTDSIDVRYVAHLARLHLTDEEAALFQAQLDQVLGYVRELSDVDVSGVEPTAHAMPVLNVFRADVPAPGLNRDDVLSNAPAVRSSLFLVPKIVE